MKKTTWMNRITWWYALPIIVVFAAAILAFRIDGPEDTAKPTVEGGGQPTSSPVEPRPMEGGGQVNVPVGPGSKVVPTLKLQNRDLPMVFEGEDVSSELQQAIEADMNTMLGNVRDFSIGKIRPEKAEKVVVGEDVLTATEKVIAWDGKVFQMPRYKHADSRLVVRVNRIPHLVINQELIKAYREALQFRAANPELMADLKKVIAQYNRGWPDVNEKNFEDYFWIHPDDAGTRSALVRNLRSGKAFFHKPERKLGQSLILCISKLSEASSPSIRDHLPTDGNVDPMIAMLQQLDDSGKPCGLDSLAYNRGRWVYLIPYPLP